MHFTIVHQLMNMNIQKSCLSTKGGEIIFVNNYKLRSVGYRINGEKRWRCTNKSCRAGCYTLDGLVTFEKEQHNHPPLESEQVELYILRRFKKRKTHEKSSKHSPKFFERISSPVNAETGSAHDETSSSGNKDDEDDDDDESDDKIDTQAHDPERLKAFNMFVRLFVDENLDRMVPISKQPKEKIQAIIDSCTRQFPEFAERARKRIRTYLKSCRRNKRARDPNSSWDTARPTPAHLTSVQAEQILATACENESHNAKRMRLGLEPVSQPMPVLPGTQAADTTAPISKGLDFSSNIAVKLEVDPVSNLFPSSTTPSSTPSVISKSLTSDLKSSLSASHVAALSASAMNGIGISNSTGSAPTAMFRPNFSQAIQRTGPYPLFPGASPFSTGGNILTNGPTDLSMKQKPLFNHKLSTGEMAAVRQLITGYRESAAFLLRSADELEQLLLQQQ